MTSTRHDELVEEIGALFCPVCDAYDVYGARCKIYLKPNECDEASLGAELAIARTLKAVVDGMPLPGEVGRGWSPPRHWFTEDEMIKERIIGHDRIRLIALSPTEEEK